jgi:hypothetical protein
MPRSSVVQDGFRLDDDQRILPRLQLACQQHEQCPVTPGELRTLYLSLEHDQLLAQESVFQHQFRLATGYARIVLKTRVLSTGFA